MTYEPVYGFADTSLLLRGLFYLLYLRVLSAFLLISCSISADNETEGFFVALQ